MKNIKFLLLLFTASLAFTGCEDVIEVDLDTAEPRLVIDASIEWIKGTDGSNQTIRLTTTTGYYEPEIPVVSGATIFVTNNTSGAVFTFNEAPNTGNYVCTDFIPVINDEYSLTVINDGETYTATEKLFAVPEISNVIQDDEGGVLGDEIEVRFFWQDNGAEVNYYMARFDIDLLPYPDYDALDDEFFQGNEMFAFISHEDLKAGDVVHFKLGGTSERFFNYLMQLTNVAEPGGGPFQTPPTTVRGNLVNETNIDNYAYGYFRVTEVDIMEYTVQ